MRARCHHDRMETTLSLGAELLLVATDPNRAGLLPRRRRRFRRALAAAQGISRFAPLAGRRAAAGPRLRARQGAGRSARPRAAAPDGMVRTAVRLALPGRAPPRSAPHSAHAGAAVPGVGSARTRERGG